MEKNSKTFVEMSNVFLRTQKDEMGDILEKKARGMKKSRVMKNSFPDTLSQVVAKIDLNIKSTKYISGYKTLG